MKRTATAIAGLIFLSGCNGLGLGPGDAPHLYMLTPQFAASTAPAVTWRLQVADPDAPDAIDTARIALVNPPARLDYYANAAWADRLPTLVQAALVQGFERSGKIAAVAPDSAGLRSDYILQTDIREFAAVYDVADSAPRVKIRIMAKLIRSRGRDIVQSLEVSHEAQASANSVDAVVGAGNSALGAAVSQLVDWALRAPPPPPES